MEANEVKVRARKARGEGEIRKSSVELCDFSACFNYTAYAREWKAQHVPI